MATYRISYSSKYANTGTRDTAITALTSLLTSIPHQNVAGRFSPGINSFTTGLTLSITVDEAQVNVGQLFKDIQDLIGVTNRNSGAFASCYMEPK